MDSIYTNAQEFGVFYAQIMFAIALGIALVMLWWSWSIGAKNARYKGVTKAQVSDAACEAVTDKVMSCAVDAAYSVDGKDLSVTNFAVKTPALIRRGDKVKLNFNLSNPADVVAASSLIPNSWSTTLVYAAIVIVIIAAIKLMLATRWKFAAAGSGLSGVLQTFRL